MAVDPSAPARLTVRSISTTTSLGLRIASRLARILERALEMMRDQIEAQTQFELLGGIAKDYERLVEGQALLHAARQESIQRAEIYAQL